MNESWGDDESEGSMCERAREESAIGYWAQHFGVTPAELNELLEEYDVPVGEIELALSR
jgi:hypothetical protein